MIALGPVSQRCSDTRMWDGSVERLIPQAMNSFLTTLDDSWDKDPNDFRTSKAFASFVAFGTVGNENPRRTGLQEPHCQLELGQLRSHRARGDRNVSPGPLLPGVDGIWGETYGT